MVEISKGGCEREDNSEKMGSVEKGGMMKRSERCDSFALDIENLLHFADMDLTGSPRSTLQRNLSRKGCGRGERKGAGQKEKPDTPKGGLGGVSTPEKSVAVPLLVTTAVDPIIIADTRYRRSSSSNRRSSWGDPRRILFFFATLSSMGTIILIYFTLSLGKINGTDEALAQ
ncbi:uncharacterized protein LOC131239060 [Magnolia sinica]|uniref:uncharacterized protein LOC131239060 n=1 Tax=Magnolia sinica TaxID=86752 RepID=UPI002659801F|nr:uncharacterized protein LOC131239060 [Magnolia sinica]